MSLFERERQMVTHVPAVAQEVYDVAGAGDTVIAAFTISMAVGGTPVDAVILSNAAAGVVVGKMGIATISPEDLHQALGEQEQSLLAFQQETLK
jgi:bifunctional ADP-heptose synthase (sugar kinase/adenylyltransferase)